MSECTDRRFREMLHLYELGQLKPEQLEELEIHLLECDACFEEVQQCRYRSTGRDKTRISRGKTVQKETLDNLGAGHFDGFDFYSIDIERLAVRHPPLPGSARCREPFGGHVF